MPVLTSAIVEVPLSTTQPNPDSNNQNAQPVPTLPTVDARLLSNFVDPIALIPKLLEITWFAAVPFTDDTKNIKPFTESLPIAVAPEEADAEVVDQSMKMLVACCLAHPDLLRQLIQHPSIDHWLSHVLLYTPEKLIRVHVMNGLYQICRNITQRYITCFVERVVKFMLKGIG